MTIHRIHRHGDLVECRCDDPPGKYARCYLLEEDETPKGFGELVLLAAVDLSRNRIILQLRRPNDYSGQPLEPNSYSTRPRDSKEPGGQLWGSEVKIKTGWFDGSTLEERVRDEVRKALVRTSGDYIAKRSSEEVEAVALDAVGAGLRTGGPTIEHRMGASSQAPIKHLRPLDPDSFDQ